MVMGMFDTLHWTEEMVLFICWIPALVWWHGEYCRLRLRAKHKQMRYHVDPKRLEAHAKARQIIAARGGPLAEWQAEDLRRTEMEEEWSRQFQMEVSKLYPGTTVF